MPKTDSVCLIEPFVLQEFPNFIFSIGKVGISDKKAGFFKKEIEFFVKFGKYTLFYKKSMVYYIQQRLMESLPLRLYLTKTAEPGERNQVL